MLLLSGIRRQRRCDEPDPFRLLSRISDSQKDESGFSGYRRDSDSQGRDGDLFLCQKGSGTSGQAGDRPFFCHHASRQRGPEALPGPVAPVFRGSLCGRRPCGAERGKRREGSSVSHGQTMAPDHERRREKPPCQSFGLGETGDSVQDHAAETQTAAVERRRDPGGIREL